MMKKLCVIFLALLLSVQMTAMAEGEITGTVYGNGTVTVEKGSNGVTFTFVPGAANKVSSFTVDGETVDVNDNQATVKDAGTYEAVFEGEAKSLTRETPKIVMENGVVANDGLSVKDSVNKLQMSRNSGDGSVPAFGTAGYEISRTGNSKERMTLSREPADGGLARTAVGRTYEPVFYYTNTHPTWNINVSFYEVQIYTGFMNDSSTRIFINGCNDSWHAKAAAIPTTNTISNSTVGRAVPGAAFTVESFTDSDRNEITDKSVYATLKRAIFINPTIGGYGDGHVYMSGISFNETASYHTVTADIGEGSMRFSSESLNFGTDNNNVLVKNGVALAVEDNRPATFTVTAPEGKAVEKVEWNGTVLTAADGVYTIPYVSENGTVAVTYQDVIVIPEEYSKTIDFSNDAYAKETLVSTLEPYQNGTVTFTFFDNGVTGGLVAFKDGDNHLREYVKFYADGTYQFNALDGTQELGEKETTRPRSTGPHTIKITTSGTSYSVYLDDALVHSVKLSESSVGVKQVYVQKKSGAKYEIEGTPRTLYYQPITAAENQPAVAATSVIANATYENRPAAVVYVKITGTAKGAGIFLKNEEGNELALNAYNVDNTLLTSGAFGIRVFGDAMKVGSKYQFIPFVTYDNGADEVTERSDGDSFTLTAAE